MDPTRGRPTTLTPALTKKLADAFKDGASVRVACSLAGIAVTTFTKWMRAGRDGDDRFISFVSLMQKARAQPELEAYQAILKAFLDAAEPDWKAAAKYIELKDPNRWRKDDRTTQVTIIDGQELLRQAEERKRTREGQ